MKMIFEFRSDVTKAGLVSTIYVELRAADGVARTAEDYADGIDKAVVDFAHQEAKKFDLVAGDVVDLALISINDVHVELDVLELLKDPEKVMRVAKLIAAHEEDPNLSIDIVEATARESRALMILEDGNDRIVPADKRLNLFFEFMVNTDPESESIEGCHGYFVSVAGDCFHCLHQLAFLDMLASAKVDMGLDETTNISITLAAVNNIMVFEDEVYLLKGDAIDRLGEVILANTQPGLTEAICKETDNVDRGEVIQVDGVYSFVPAKKQSA